MFYILFFYLKKWVNRSFPLLASDGSESLRSLTKNERPWGFCSHRSEEISDREQIAQIAHQKWANEWIARFFSKSLMRSFLGKKQVISLENRWANSQPCSRHCICQHLTLPAGPASLHRRTHSMSLYGHGGFNSQRRPPPLSHLGMLFIYGNNICLT